LLSVAVGATAAKTAKRCCAIGVPPCPRFPAQP